MPIAPGTVIPAGTPVSPGGDIGMPGPGGPTAVSTDAGNSATLGSDKLIYVPPPASLSPTADYYDWDDFVGTNPITAASCNTKLLTVNASVLGTGAAAGSYSADIPGHPGVLQMAPGTTAGSGLRAYPPQGQLKLNPGYTITLQAVVEIFSGGFAGTNQYFFGFADLLGNAISATYHYLGWFAAFNIDPTNWRPYARNAANVDYPTNGVPGGGGAWHKFKIVASATEVDFYADDVLIYSETNASYISTVQMYPCLFTNNGTGTSNFSFMVDTYDILIQPGGPTRFMRTL